MSAPLPARLPVSTYRLQLSTAFTLFDAAALVPYLAELGVTECYCSPILKSRPGSTHGYDVVDHSRIDPDLGGDEGFHALASACRARGLGVVLDFVPNHMSTDPEANAWWRSVLENGPSSFFAKYFDIDWDPIQPQLKQKVLLPILGEAYGATLESGALRVEMDARRIRLRYHDSTLPLNPRYLRLLLAHDLERLAHDLPPDAPELTEFRSVLFHLDHLPSYTETDPGRMADRKREREVAIGRLATLLEEHPRVRRHVEENIRRYNGTPGDPTSFDLLHELLERQPYRLASWRTAVHEINYRRFFDLNDLAGLRPEDPEVFEAMHARVAALVRDGLVSGLRLDHIDGLFDPAQYLRDLQVSCGDARCWVIAEKILSAGECLQADWQTHGTTGYDFLNDVNGVFVDETNAGRLRRVHARFTGDGADFRDVAYTAKRLITATSMASELNVLADELNRISEGNRHWRDFTLDSLQEALREVVACFPVYRTYVSGGGFTADDGERVDQAIGEALRRNPALEPTIFRFIREMLLSSRSLGLPEVDYARRLRFAMRFQQYTSPVHAKGVEDTAFYRYFPLLSLNEVGAGSAAAGVTVTEFHQRNARRRQDWPLTMTSTATHDTKRGEDARPRLSVLSEIPERWRVSVARWSQLNAVARQRAGEGPDASDEYFYYQTLVGAWPAHPSWRPDAAFVHRVRDCMRKAMREAKRHTSWVNPSASYEDATLRFVEATLTEPASAAFRRSFAYFAHRVAFLGMLNSLAQLVLKIASPGVPDFYQGSESWDLNLVDPDNRRAVDFSARRQWLASITPLLEATHAAGDRAALVRQVLDHWTDGRVKLFVTTVGLRLRRRLRDLFLSGDYRPVEASGTLTRHVVAFVRQHESTRLLAVVPRLPASLSRRGQGPPLGDRWAGASLPVGGAPAIWRNAFTGETITSAGTLSLATVLASFPVALLVSETPT
jgi:(1->4)-alpha-D-glucan 1-alpha-D-glucosylmutase